MADMTVAEAVDALRPLVAQRRALDKLEGVLEVAHRVAGDIPTLERRAAEARAAAEKVDAECKAAIAADRKRAADAKARADKAEADAAADAAKAQADAADKIAAAQVAATEQLTTLAASVKAEEARLAEVQGKVDAAQIALRHAEDALAAIKAKLG